MTTTNWRKSLVSFIRVEAQPVDKFGHQPRIYALANKIGEGMEFDDDVVFAAAWMHDLGVFLGHRPVDPEQLARWNHVPYTVALTRKLLEDWGFPAGKLDAVADVIRTHQPGDDPTSLEAMIVRDADILEQLGAIGALRAFVKIGRDTRYTTFSSVVPVLQWALENLPAKLRLESSRRLAAPREHTLRAFLDAVAAEAGDHLN